jgi:hypothetical protein
MSTQTVLLSNALLLLPLLGRQHSQIRMSIQTALLLNARRLLLRRQHDQVLLRQTRMSTQTVLLSNALLLLPLLGRQHSQTRMSIQKVQLSLKLLVRHRLLLLNEMQNRNLYQHLHQHLFLQLRLLYRKRFLVLLQSESHLLKQLQLPLLHHLLLLQLYLSH